MDSKPRIQLPKDSSEGPFMIDPLVLFALQDAEGGRKGNHRRSLMERRWEVKGRQDFLQLAGQEISAEIQSQGHSALLEKPRKTLYERGLESREKTKSQLRAHIQAEQASKCSFRPALDQKSQRLQPRYEQNPIEDSLLHWGSQKELRMKELQTSFSQVELHDCSFSPEIDPNSAQMAANSAEPRYLSLYKLNEQLKNRRHEAESQPQFPFHPHIFASKPHPETPSQFLSRLHQSKLRAGGSAAPQQPPESEPIPNGKQVRREGPPVHEYLYALAGKKEEPLVETPHREVVANPKSQQLFSKRLEDRIRALFGTIDGDRDGQVSGWVGEVEGLGKEQRRLLDPVFREIEAAEEPWAVEQFSTRVKQLCTSLTIAKRNSLLLRTQSPPQPATKLPHKSDSASVLRLHSCKYSEVCAK